MPIRTVRRKIAELRTQPEPVRYRAAVILTGVSGAIIGLLWLVVLLPLQLRLGQSQSSPDESVSEPAPTEQATVPTSGSPQLSKKDIFDWSGTTSTVAGIKDAEANPSPSLNTIPVSTTTPLTDNPPPLVSPTPSPTSSPGAVATPGAKPSPTPSSLPVEVTQ